MGTPCGNFLTPHAFVHARNSRNAHKAHVACNAPLSVCVCVQVNIPLGEAITKHTKHAGHTQEPSKQNAHIAQNFLWATRSICKGEPILVATEQTAELVATGSFARTCAHARCPLHVLRHAMFKDAAHSAMNSGSTCSRTRG